MGKLPASDQKGQFKVNGLAICGILAVMLTCFYLMTSRVYYEGSLGQSDLILMPYPSIDLIVGGGEEGAWAKDHPNQPKPWWQKDDTVKLIYLGDWEDPSIWGELHSAGILLTLSLWLTVFIILLRRLWIIMSQYLKKRLH